MVYCHVLNCINNTQKRNDCRLFRFPAEEFRRAIWVQNCGLANLMRSSRPWFCKEHFDNNQWDCRRRNKLKKLKSNAIPTIFNDPNSLVSLLPKSEPSFVETNSQYHYELNGNPLKLEIDIDNQNSNVEGHFDENQWDSPRNDKRKKLEPNGIRYGIPTIFNEPNPLVSLLPKSEPSIADTNSQYCYELNNNRLKLEIDIENEKGDVKTEIPSEDVNCCSTEPASHDLTEDNVFHKIHVVTITNSEQSNNLNPIVIKPCFIPLVRCDLNRSSNSSSKDKKISPEKGYYCKICNKRFLLKLNLKIHMEMKIACRDSFETEKLIINSHLKPEFRCKLCNKVFSQENLLKGHIAQSHNANKVFQCSVCFETFSMIAKLKWHVEVHLHYDEPFKCLKCSKTFSEVHSLKVHSKSHKASKKIDRLKISKEFPRIKFIRQGRILSNNSDKPAYSLEVEKSVSPIVNVESNSDNKSVDSNKECSLSNDHNNAIQTQTKNFMCSLCPKSFSSSQGLNEHERYHIGSRPYKCQECGKGFHRRGNLRVHLMLHTFSKSFDCAICGQKFLRISHLKNHKRIVHLHEQPFKCLICNEHFLEYLQLKEHIKSHDNVKPFKCSVCNSLFHRREELLAHMKSHSGQALYKCLNCNKEFYKRRDMDNHIQLHISAKSFKCDQCNIAIADAQSFENHMRSHISIVKPYKCSFCTKSFSTSCRLEEHTRLHTGDRPFECLICKRRFLRSENLKDHIKIHSDIKNFECSVCKLSFRRSQDLKAHFRRHMGIKPFKCLTCNTSFTKSYELSRHMKMHDISNTSLSFLDHKTEVRKEYRSDIHVTPPKTFCRSDNLKEDMKLLVSKELFKCSECDLSFNQSSDLKAHERNHINIKNGPFKCSQCDEVFLAFSELNYHLKEHLRMQPFEFVACSSDFILVNM